MPRARGERGTGDGVGDRGDRGMRAGGGEGRRRQLETTPDGPHHPDESLLHLRRLLVSGYMIPPLPP